MKPFEKENEEAGQPPERQGDPSPASEGYPAEPEEEQEEPVEWDGSEAELVADGADQEYKDTVTGFKFSYILREEEIYACMKETQYDQKRKRRTAVELCIFSALLLFFLVSFFLYRQPDNLFFATVCAAFIFIMIFLPGIRIKQDAKRNADDKEVCMEVYPDEIVMGQGERKWKIPLDGSCRSAVIQQNLVVYFKGDDMVILPMRCVEPDILPEIEAIIQAGTSRSKE